MSPRALKRGEGGAAVVEVRTVLPEQGDILRELVATTLSELLAAYEVEAERLDGEASTDEEAISPGSEPGIAGVIGFTADAMRGSMVVYGYRKVLGAMGQTDSSDLALRDWAGEVSNQMLGRLKNKLLAYGVVLSMSTPVVVVGFRLDVSALSGASRIACAARTPHGVIRVSLDAVAQDGVLLEVKEQIPMGASEGELLLF